MTKRSLLLLLVATMLLACGCTAREAQPATQRLVIGCDYYEPYTYIDSDGNPAGLDVALAQEACRRMGYEPVFLRINWSRRDELLENGEIDCLWSCFTMDGNEDKYAWVGPYMRSRQVVAVLESSLIQRLEQLDGKSIAVCDGSKAELIFLEHKENGIPAVKNVYSLSTSEEVATALRYDYVDAVAGSAATLREALQKYDISFRFLDDLSHASLGVAFRKGSDPSVQQKLSAALDAMLKDGTTAQILATYGVNIEKALGGLAQ